MAINVANYQATIKFDASDFKKGMQSSEKSFSGFSSKIGSLAKGIGTGLTTALGAGVTAMTALTTKALSLSGELEQNMGGSEAVFKEYASEMQKTAKEAATNAGLATSDYLATANKMGALFQGSGFTIQESFKLTQDSMQRAADVASIMGIDVSAAMEAVAGAAKGNFTMMDNLGVAMNATTIEAYALSKGINKSYNEMTNQEKIGLAMEMFMEKSAYAAGNYAKENETLAGSLTTAKAALTNFLDGSGSVDGLVSAFTNAGNVIVENLVQILPRLVTGITQIIQQLVPQIPPLLQALLPAVVNGAVQLVNGLVAALPAIISALMACLPDLISGVQQIIDGLLVVLPGMLATILNAVLEIMPQLCTSLIALLPTLLDTVLQMIEGVAQSLLEAIPIIIAALPELINSIVTFVLNAIPQIIQTGIQLFTSLVQALPQIITAIVAAIPKIIDNLITAIIGSIPQIVQAGIDLLVSLIKNLPTIIQTIVKAIPQIITSLVDAIVNNIPAIIQAGFQLLVSLVKNLPKIIVEIVKAVPKIIEGIVKAFGSLMGKIVEIGGNIVKGLWDGITGLASWLWDKVSGWISGIWDGICNFFGIHSPSREMAWVGEMLVKGLAGSIEHNGDEANEASEKLSQNVLDTFEDMADNITDIENGLVDDVDVSARKKVTLSAAYDNASLNGSISNSVAISGNTLTDGLSILFDAFIGKTETLLNKLIDSVSVGSANGVSTSNISTVINMGDISVSGVIDKGAAEQINDIVQKQTDSVKNYVDESAKREYSRVMEKAKKDKNFESMVQDMTLGNAMGKSSLTKNKYKY